MFQKIENHTSTRLSVACRRDNAVLIEKKSKGVLYNCTIIFNCELVSDVKQNSWKNIIVLVMSSVDCLLITIVFS